MIALVFGEMDRRKLIERARASRPKYSPTLVKTEKVEKKAYTQGDFDQLWVDFQEVGGYFPVPGTLN